MSNLLIYDMSNLLIYDMSNLFIYDMSNLYIYYMSNLFIYDMSNLFIYYMSNLFIYDMSNLFIYHMSNLFIYCHHWASVVCRPSVNFSHFNQLLWSHWANLNQTLVECSLDGPLLKLCPMIPTSNQDGRQAKNRKKGGWNFNCSLLL